ncbi:MAG TPA: AAA family ATPase [Steroidobacteraceae bacterium]|nr:AAA family ATPase [Steroidobacteraceae bacterium]
MELLERQQHLDELARQLREAEAGRGKVAFVGGEAGAGKSALIEAFTSGVRRGVRIAWGACDALQTPRTLGPIHEVAAALSVASPDAAQGEQRPEFFARLVDTLAQPTQVTVVVLEDLHWADEATLDFVHFLGRRIQRTRCVLIGSYRDDELATIHPLRRVLGEITGQHAARLRIPALSAAAVAQLAHSAHRDAARIYELTGGNAFFVRELLTAPSDSLPESARDAVIARFMQCSPAARELAELVAVSPGRTEMWLARSLLGQVHRSADEGIERGLLRLGDDCMAYRHELGRLAVESTLSSARSQELHQRILDALIAHGADLSQLVHHAQLAGNVRAIIDFAPRAARQASQLGAHAEAAAHLAAALRHAHAVPAVERARWFESHCWECNLTNQALQAAQSGEQALELYREVSDTEAQARVLRVLARVYWQLGRRPQADRSVADAIALLEALKPGHEMAMAYGTRSMLAMLGGRVEEAIGYGERTLELARQLGDVEPQVQALNTIGSSRLGSGDTSGFPLVEEALALGVKHSLHDGAGRAFTNLATCSMLHFDLPRAEGHLRRGLAYCEEHEVYTHAYYLRAYETRLELLRGRWNDAANLATQLLEAFYLTTNQRIPTLITLALVRARRGDPGAEPLLDEALILAMPTAELQRIGRVAAARAEVAWYRDDLEAVAREVAIGLEVARGHRDPGICGELAFWARRADPALTIDCEIAEPYRLMVEGKWRAAADTWEKLGMPYERTLALAEGSEEDLLEALPVLEALGAGPLAAKVRQRLRDRGVKGIPRGPRASTRGNPAGLTTREVDVLRLLVGGHTNAELARRLHLSAKTVDHHVSSILDKLEVHSRTEAVAAAFGLGIVKAEH